MYLKTLVIKGFKSFADRTKLQFEPGITVVVGPNGSGKSNITDAVLWVLGEQSAISLRGTAMEDVIFAGSPARTSAGLAEVTLTLDNSDGVLPIEFSEVSITRRISRMGDSDYLINNAPCRLLDVQELLMDSGLGKEMYSIVSQGKLEQILVSKPEERRLLIEEAAGVLKHKIRKERAMRKLVSMEQNLIRAKDVLKEINRQIQPLERQARKAENHKRIAETLRGLEITFNVRHLENMQDEWTELAANESNWEKNLDELKHEIVKEDQKRESLRKTIEKEQAYGLGLEEHKRRFQSCFDRFNSMYLLAEEKGKALAVRKKELQEKIDQLQQRIGRRERESLELGEKKDSFQSDRKAISRKLAELQERLNESKADEMRLAKELEKMESQKSEAQRNHSQKEQNLRAIRSDIESFQMKSVFAGKQEESYLVKIGKSQTDLEKIEHDSQVQREECAHWSEKKTHAESAIQQADEILNRLEQEIDEKRERIRGLQAERKALDDFRAALGGLSGIEPAEGANISGIMGILGELIEVPKKYERAFDAILGTDLLCLTVKKYEQAEQVLSLMQNEQKGLFGLVVTEAIDEQPVSVDFGEGFIPMGDVIQCGNELKQSIKHLLNNVFVVPDAASAIRSLKQKRRKGQRYTLVTENGEVFYSSGKIYAGFRQKLLRMFQGQSSGQFGAEEKKHLDILRGLEKKKLAELEHRRDLTEQLKSFSNSLREHEFALQTCVAEQKRLVEEIHHTQGERKAAAEDRKSWETKIEDKKRIEADLHGEIGKSAHRLKSLNNDISRLRRDRQLINEDRKNSEQGIIKMRLELDALIQKEDYMAKQGGLITEDQAELRQLLDSELCLGQSFDRFESRLQPLELIFKALIAATEEFMGAVADKISKKKDSLLELKNAMELERAESSSLREQVGTVAEKIQNVRVLKAQLEVEVKSISERIVEQFEVPLDRAVEVYKTDRTTKDLKQEIDQMRKQIKELGAVNPIAIEDFTNLKERQAFLSDQISDLTDSRRALEKVAGEIDRRIQDQFLSTFEEVNSHFQSIFSYLFEGGNAELILDRPGDVLDSGVSLSVHPEGKRLQKVTLLSGGEAALVALAFLFAIHHTRPSPFYILDEVEPALDSINLRRFTDFLRSQSKKTQFLIITHQKRTMEIADLLYGVSMEPEGVSSVISQRLSEFPDIEDRRAYVS